METRPKNLRLPDDVRTLVHTAQAHLRAHVAPPDGRGWTFTATIVHLVRLGAAQLAAEPPPRPFEAQLQRLADRITRRRRAEREAAPSPLAWDVLGR